MTSGVTEAKAAFKQLFGNYLNLTSSTIMKLGRGRYDLDDLKTDIPDMQVSEKILGQRMLETSVNRTPILSTMTFTMTVGSCSPNLAHWVGGGAAGETE